MKQASIFLFVLSLLFLSSCSGNTGIKSSDIEAIDIEETYEDGPFSLDRTYSSIEELYTDSDLVIECRVESTEVVDVDGFPQTHSMVIIDDVLKGDNTEQTVIVMEEGGSSEKLGSALLSVPPLEAGQHLILFLVKSEMPGFENHYYVTGAFQGKFIEREGYFFQQATSDVKLSHEAYYPMNHDDFINFIEHLK